MRGIDRQRIFEDPEDHYIFLQCLSSAQEQYSPEGKRLLNSCHYHAYALMLWAGRPPPLGENISCLEYEDERSRSISDDQVMLYLFEEFGISDGQQLQRLDKEQRNDILSALLSRRAGIRQLQRLTGIGKNIISNISKTILKQSGHGPVPLSLY